MLTRSDSQTRNDSYSSGIGGTVQYDILVRSHKNKAARTKPRPFLAKSGRPFVIQVRDAGATIASLTAAMAGGRVIGHRYANLLDEKGMGGHGQRGLHLY